MKWILAVATIALLVFIVVSLASMAQPSKTTHAEIPPVITRVPD